MTEPTETAPVATRRQRSLSGRGVPALIPQGLLSGPMPWVIAIMVALTVVAAAAALALSNTTAAAADALSGGATIQVVEANPEERDRQARDAARVVQAMPGVVDIRIVSQAEIQQLVEPWLGVRGSADQIPVPALVDVRWSSPVTGEKLEQMRNKLKQIAPAARVDAQSTWLKPVFSAIESLRWLALSLVVLLGCAMAAAVLLAVRSALGAHHETIEIVHLLGATDSQIAQIFQRSIGMEAASGGLIGLGLGAAVVALLGERLASLGAGLVATGALGMLDWVLLALVPVAGVGLAIFTARLTVLRALRRIL